MYGLLVEYGGGLACPPDGTARWGYRELLARLPGYRRRLDLQADGYRRLADFCLFASREAAEAALACAERRAFVAAHPACADTGLALLVREAGPLGGRVTLLRRTGDRSPTGAQQCWRDHFDLAAGYPELW